MPNQFARLIFTRALFTFAVQMQAVLVGWQVYALTHDALALGMVGLAEAVPALSLAMFAGYVVDKGDPKRIYRNVLILSFISGAFLLGSTFLHDGLIPHSQLAVLYIASILTGIARAFSQPAMYTLVPNLVAREDLPEASAWMSSSLQIARIVGPAVGGLVYAYLGMRFSSCMICTLLLAAIVLISSIQVHIPARNAGNDIGKTARDLLGGLDFVLHHPILLSALSLDMVSVLFGGVTALLPIYAEEILHLGPKGLGFLRAAPAIGATLGSLGLTQLPIKRHAGAWLLGSVGAFGVCMLLFSISQNAIVSLVVLFFSGIFDSVSVLVRTVVVQLASPDHMRGRIAAVNSMFIGSSNEIGELESGVAAKLLGVVPSAVFGSCMCILTVILMAYRSPTLRKLDLDDLEA